MNQSAFAFGLGTGTWSAGGALLEAWFPVVLHQPSESLVKSLRALLALPGGNQTCEGDSKNTEAVASALGEAGFDEAGKIAARLATSDQKVVFVLLSEDSKLQNTAEAYLKLHLLSLRHVLPNQLNLDGIFSTLPNLAWTSEGVILPEELPERRLSARLAGRSLMVNSVDKFPRMTDYVLPSGVRIADGRRIRLGAYLGDGTTVMHEGFVNFNAGTTGTAMVEGRLSQGVVMGEDSDLGGSASTMGTLSGGGESVISIGRHCLIGANAGTGIPLGDRCIIEAGLYITAGMVVHVFNEDRKLIDVVKARTLAGQSDLLFIRDSQTGRLECRTNNKAIELNASLHTNN